MRDAVIFEGRLFDAHDLASRQRVAIVSRMAVQRYFLNGQSPVGRKIRIEDKVGANWEIVGVAGDVNDRPDLPPRPQVYVPMEQSPTDTMALVIRSDKNPLSIARPLRDLVRKIDADQAITDVKSVVDVRNEATACWRVSTSVFTGFGASALLLALVGLYSIVSYTVVQRTREIAIRIALGSSYFQIIKTVLRSLGMISLIGTALGIPLTVVFRRSLESLLCGLDPFDPVTMAAAASAFGTIAANRCNRCFQSDSNRAHGRTDGGIEGIGPAQAPADFVAPSLKKCPAPPICLSPTRWTQRVAGFDFNERKSQPLYGPFSATAFSGVFTSESKSKKILCFLAAALGCPFCTARQKTASGKQPILPQA